MRRLWGFLTQDGRVAWSLLWIGALAVVGGSCRGSGIRVRSDWTVVADGGAQVLLPAGVLSQSVWATVNEMHGSELVDLALPITEYLDREIEVNSDVEYTRVTEVVGILPYAMTFLQPATVSLVVDTGVLPSEVLEAFEAEPVSTFPEVVDTDGDEDTRVVYVDELTDAQRSLLDFHVLRLDDAQDDTWEVLQITPWIEAGSLLFPIDRFGIYTVIYSPRSCISDGRICDAEDQEIFEQCVATISEDRQEECLHYLRCSGTVSITTSNLSYVLEDYLERRHHLACGCEDGRYERDGMSGRVFNAGYCNEYGSCTYDGAAEPTCECDFGFSGDQCTSVEACGLFCDTALALECPDQPYGDACVSECEDVLLGLHTECRVATLDVYQCLIDRVLSGGDVFDPNEGGEDSGMSEGEDLELSDAEWLALNMACSEDIEGTVEAQVGGAIEWVSDGPCSDLVRWRTFACHDYQYSHELYEPYPRPRPDLELDDTGMGDTGETEE